MKKKVTTMALPDDLFWDLKQICIKEQTTQQALLVRALREYITRYKESNPIPEYSAK